MSPLRNAVCLVNRDQRRLGTGQKLGKAGDTESFGGDKEKVECASKVFDAHGTGFKPRSSRVNPFRPQAQFLEFGDLILHQGDQWTDHQRRAAACQSRELIA